MAEFPSVAMIARELVEINHSVDDECDVRLQVYPDGSWAVRAGDSSFDTDHRGFWGSSSVPGRGEAFDSTEVAKDLLFQAEEAAFEHDSSADETDL